MPEWLTIKTHEDRSTDDFVAFMCNEYQRAQHAPAPAIPVLVGNLPEAFARVDHGRWIADCSTGCGYAVMLGRNTSLFLCANCDVGWQRVTWPRSRTNIEIELLKRPHDIRAEPEPSTRNWVPGETLADLRTENADRGIF